MGASCGTTGKKEGGSSIIQAPPFDPNLKIEDQGLKNVINDIESLIQQLQQLNAQVLKIPQRADEIQLQ